MQGLFGGLKELWGARNQLGKATSVVTLFIAVLFVGFVLFWLVDRIFLLSISRSYVDQIAIVFNLNRHLAEAISLVVCVLLAACASLIFSLSSRKRLAGVLGVVCLLILNSLALWIGSRGEFFEASGKATKCYVMTREGVRFGERPGIDLETGRPCRLVTPDLIERLRLYAQGKRPERITADEPAFFDLKTGEPAVWYARSKTGEIELFDLMGYHPETGEELQPVTREIVQQWQAQQKEIAQRPPQRIDPEKFTFFDPKTGKVRAWYWRSADGTFEFYDNKGFQPSTGDALQPVTHAIIAAWKSAASIAVTRPPTRIDPDKYAFFDSVTGKPRVWYWHGGKGQWEFYDNRGYRSAGGEELKLISNDVINSWRQEIEQQKQEAAEAAAKAQEARLASEKAAAEKLLEQQKAEAERQLAAQKAEADKQAAEAAKQTEQQKAGDDCDRAASNPTDKNRPSTVPGVEYNDLKAEAQTAADACAVAAKMHPEEPRFRYNWARALEFINPQQAINLYAELIKENYVSAYDNYAGLIWRERKNLPAAIKLWETGVRLGDPSAMVSIAYLIKHNLYQVANPMAARHALLMTAAQAGSTQAQKMLDEEQQEVQQQQNKQEQERMMLNLFGTMVRGMAR